MGTIRSTALSFSVCLRFRLRAEVISHGSSSSLRQDGRELRATRGPEDVEMHSHPNRESLKQKSEENNLSHTHTQTNTQTEFTLEFSNLCLAAVSV